MMKPHKLQKELDLLKRAFEAAEQATQNYLNEHPNDWYPCGFAWVKIRPARGRLVSALKEQQIGRTNEFEGGYDVWNPSNNSTQAMYAKEAGALAFAKVLREDGIKCSTHTRVD